MYPYFISSLDEEGEDGRICRRLYDKDSDMAPETQDLILASYKELVIDAPSDSAVVERRRKWLSKLLDFQYMAYTENELAEVSAAMDRTHEGMRVLKDVLLSEIASAVVTGKPPKAMLVVGEPGCGKTSLLRSLASALPRHGSSFISLSGKSAAFELKGNDPGWKDADAGLVFKAVMNAGSLTPIIIFDELDKLGTNDRYSKADTAFLDLLQAESVKTFTDDYFSFPIDLSGAWFIFTANTLEGVSAPVLDRLRVFQMDTYGFEERVRIASRMVDKANKDHPSKRVVFSKEALGMMAFKSMGSSSVRPLGDMVDLVMASKAQVFLGNKRIRKLEVSAREVEAIWASCHPRPRNLVEDFAYPAGVVSGLAVSMGEGFMVPVEARNSRQGDLKELRLTGLYDRSMGESAEVAYELVDSWAMEHLGHGLGVVAVNYSYAVEKRGDSASLATALAIISDLLGHPVPKTTAVTGAVSLKGNVLPVGSVVAKVLGAASQGADTVITPCCDSDGLSGIPEGYLPRIRIIRVRCFSEAVEAAFGPVLVQDGPKVRTAS